MADCTARKPAVDRIRGFARGTFAGLRLYPRQVPFFCDRCGIRYCRHIASSGAIRSGALRYAGLVFN